MDSDSIKKDVMKTFDDKVRATLTGLFSVLALFAAIPKLLLTSGMTENMVALGYGPAFTVFIGAAWILAAVGVWSHSYRRLATLLTFPIISGGIAAHLSTGEGSPIPLIIIATVGLALLLNEKILEYAVRTG